MPYRLIPFINNGFYHLYNRGLQREPIFNNYRDYSFFLRSFFYYQVENPKPKFSLYRQSKVFPIDPTKKMVEILAYCLMPNHFHLFVKQVRDNGISEFMRKFIHSYTKYRNVKYKRQGPVLNGVFKAVTIETDEQLVHVSRYIHLNPLVSRLVKDLRLYQWSSYPVYIGLQNNEQIAKDHVLNFFKNSQAYEKFVLDQAEYGTTLEQIKHLLIDVDEH